MTTLVQIEAQLAALKLMIDSALKTMAIWALRIGRVVIAPGIRERVRTTADNAPIQTRN